MTTEPPPRTCFTCKHEPTPAECNPCRDCIERSGFSAINWEARPNPAPQAKAPQLLYGLDHWEQLKEGLDEVIDKVVDNHVEVVGEPIKDTLDRISWPIEIHSFQRMDVAKQAGRLARRALEGALEDLDETYSDPDSDGTTPNEAMKAAAAAFAGVIVNNYVPWACEPTGEIIRIHREDVEKTIGGGK